jgi:hypothetical protein
MPDDTPTDKWRKAILKERENAHIQPLLMATVKKINPNQRHSALVLGDASLVYVKYLLDIARFKHVVDVDASPSLMDDEFGLGADIRLKRVQSPFDKYQPAAGELFDLVYGKSIAFNPKDTIVELLKTIKAVLTTQGVFAAEFAGEKDTFRKIHYTNEELHKLFTDAGFGDIQIKELLPKNITGLVREGVTHTFRVLTKKI